MGKQPGFYFYSGDWIKDPELRRCSKAAKGVWIDMLALLSECSDRGVFMTGGEPWTDQEIAAAIGGDIAENLKCLEELLRKGVARRNTSGAIFSARMVRDQQERVNGKVRKQNQRDREKSHEIVTPSVTPVSEREREREVEVEFKVEGFDSEKAVRDIQHAHPRPENSVANENSVIEAIEYVSLKRNCSRSEAAEWLLARTEMYRVRTDAWPKPERQFITKATRWFSLHQFEESEEFWDRRAPGKTQTDPKQLAADYETRKRKGASA